MSEERWVWVPFEVDKKFDGYRIDRFLTQRLAGYSRSKIQTILSDARVMKEDRAAKANTKVRSGDKIRIAYLRGPEAPLAPDASIPILFEDEDLLIVNKPADLLSHPTDKIVDNTVLGLLRHCRPDLPKLHLLHRLDRETSGVIALAKNAQTARAWTRHMEAHRIQKEYIAMVRGKVSPKDGTIDMPIGRQGADIRVRQWVHVPSAAPAITKYRVITHFWGQSPQMRYIRLWGLSPIRQTTGGRRMCGVSIVRVFPQTGRLHQIRVHFAAIGHPLLGDPLYTGEGEIYKKMVAGTCTSADRAGLGFPRVALHAAALTFLHPTTQKELRIEAPPPPDMASLFRHTTGESPAAISDKLFAQ